MLFTADSKLEEASFPVSVSSLCTAMLVALTYISISICPWSKKRYR